MISSAILAAALCCQYPIDQYVPQIQRSERALAQPMPPNLGSRAAQWEANRSYIAHQLQVDRMLHEDADRRIVYDRLRVNRGNVSGQIMWRPRQPMLPGQSANPWTAYNPVRTWTPRSN